MSVPGKLHQGEEGPHSHKGGRIAPATCGAARLRDRSDSHGKPLTSVGTAGKAQTVQLQPGAGNALGSAFSRVGAELRHPPARSCGVRRGSPRIPNPGVGTGAWKRPDPRERPAGWERRVRGAAGRGAAMETRRASSAPRGSAVLFPTLPAPAVAWPGPPRLRR